MGYTLSSWCSLFLYAVVQEYNGIPHEAVDSREQGESILPIMNRISTACRTSFVLNFPHTEKS